MDEGSLKVQNQETDFSINITRHINKQENMVHSKEQNSLSDTVPEGTQRSALLNKDFKTAVLNVLKS
jgi:hypothetical protein